MRVLFGLILLLAGVSAWAEPLAGVVVVVIDGDTVLFRPDTYHPASRAFLRVRLVGIDAPEADQPHGEAATLALGRMALQRRASLDIAGVDRYGRKLGELVVGTQSVNTELVRQGHAWAWSREAGDPLREIEEAARRGRVGLWAEPDPVPPRAWRRRN